MASERVPEPDQEKSSFGCKRAAWRAVSRQKASSWLPVVICNANRSGQSGVLSRPVPRVMRDCRQLRRPLCTCACYTSFSECRRRASRPLPWSRCGTLPASGGLNGSSCASSLAAPGPRRGIAPTSV